MTEEKKEGTPLKKSELAEMIGTAVAEHVTPVAESLKGLSEKVTDIEKAQPRIVGEPEVEAGQTLDKSDVNKMMIANWEKQIRNDRAELPEDEFSFVRFITGQITKDWSGKPIEQEALRRTQDKMGAEEKTLAWASGSAGGYWVATEFLPKKFIDMLYAEIVCKRAGCQVWPAKGAPVNVPAKTASSTAYWVGQNADITLSDTTPATLQFTPKWCTGRSQISEFLARSSAGLAEEILRTDISRSIGIEVDKQMLIGAGTSSKPTGIAIYTAPTGRNTKAIGTNGGAITLALLHSMLYECEVDNVRATRGGWVMHPRTWNAIRQLQTVNYSGQTVGGDYYLRPDISQAENRMLLGFPVYTTTSLPIDLTKGSGTALAYVLFADFADVVLCEWGGVEIKATDIGDVAWKQNAIQVKGTYTMDVGVRHGPAVCVLSDTTS